MQHKTVRQYTKAVQSFSESFLNTFSFLYDIYDAKIMLNNGDLLKIKQFAFELKKLFGAVANGRKHLSIVTICLY